MTRSRNCYLALGLITALAPRLAGQTPVRVELSSHKPNPAHGIERFKLALSGERNHFILPAGLKLVAGLAAVIILIATLVLVFYSQNEKNQEIAILETKSGEKREVKLPDGSNIWLNQKSRLSYSKEFSMRQVKLEGEAYFEVVGRDGQLFTIFCGLTKTEVLGTSFNIKSYDSDEEIEVIVVTGKVAFTTENRDEEKVVLDPGGKAVLVKKENRIVESINDDPNFLSWKTKLGSPRK